MTPNWAIMPVLDNLDQTLAAIRDCINQSHVDAKLLVINQGSSDETKRALENLADVDLLANPPGSLFIWSHDPPLPSLSATWNRALDFVWETGGDHALVVNNDVRLHARTYSTLVQVLQLTDSLFVSAVGVTAEQFDPLAGIDLALYDGDGNAAALDKGGPDFSCFVISKACHERFRFDENFVPAYCEDLDYHRRLMLAGEAPRIFSVNLPYLHYGAGTLKNLSPDRREKIQRRIEASREYYQQKWGGQVNHETYWSPFNQDGGLPGWVGLKEPTTPALQEYFRQQELAPVLSKTPAFDLVKEDLRQGMEYYERKQYET